MSEKKETIEEEKYEPCAVTLITIYGEEVLIEFENDKGGLIFDTVLTELRESITNNQMYSSDFTDISFKGMTIDELDCSKIIGIKW